jgi:hypothetical protein
VDGHVRRDRNIHAADADVPPNGIADKAQI